MSSPEQPIQPVQSVQSAWVLRLRREALRHAGDPDMPRVLFVGLLLASFTDADGGNCWVSPETVSSGTGYSVDQVRRCIAALAGVGLLQRTRRQGKPSLLQLLLPAGAGDLDWGPHLAVFVEARQASARRRAKSAKRTAPDREHPSRRGIQNTHRDGAAEPRTPIASGNSEHPSRRGIQPAAQDQNTHRDAPTTPIATGIQNTHRVGGVPSTPTYGRDPDRDQDVSGPVPQPQVGARAAPSHDEPPPAPAGPTLQALPGGGRSPGGGHQAPLLLTVHTTATAPAPTPDLARIAEHMSELYGVVLPRRYAAPVALAVLDGLDVPDPTAYVLAALTADPGRYRPPIPDAPPRAAGDS